MPDAADIHDMKLLRRWTAMHLLAREDGSWSCQPILGLAITYHDDGRVQVTAAQ